MKNYMKRWIVMMLVMIIAFAGFGLSVDVNAQEPDATSPEEVETPVVETVNYVKVYSVTVRSKASTKKSSKKLGTLYWKDPVIVTGKKGSYKVVIYKDQTGYIKSKYLAKHVPEVTYEEKSYTRYLKKTAKIYKAPSNYSATSGKFKKAKEVTCLGTSGEFTVVKKGKKEVFVKTSALTSKKPKAKKKSKGASVAAYAKKFVGNPYKYGGTSLTHGADCSGFTMSVFKKYGIKLPHSSTAQRKYGKAVSLKNAKPGDLVCYSGHVGIYIGGGKIVHASTPKGGIKIGSVHIMKIKTIRRLL